MSSLVSVPWTIYSVVYAKRSQLKVTYTLGVVLFFTSLSSENNVQYTVYDVTLISLDSCGFILDFVTLISSELVSMTICLIVRTLRFPSSKTSNI